MKLSFGELFKRPFESSDAIIQRILTSSPGLTLAMIRQFDREFTNGGIPKLICYGNITSSVNQTLLKAYQKFQSENKFKKIQCSRLESQTKTLEDSRKRTCPECAWFNYHTPVYDLPWVVKCPIHQSLLTTTCPDCLKPWPVGRAALRSKCQRCGLFRKFPERITNREKIDDSDFLIFVSLEKLLDEKYESFSLIYGLTTEFLVRNRQKFFHTNFPSIVTAIDPSNLALLEKFGCEIDPIKKFTFRLKPAFRLTSMRQRDYTCIVLDNHIYKNPRKIPSNNAGKEKLPPHLFHIRQKAVKIIYREINQHFKLEYNPQMCYFLSGGYVRSDCPYQMALSYWYRYLLTDPFKQHHFFSPNKNPFYGPNSSCFFPDPVLPVRYVLVKNKLFKLPRKAQQLVYLNDLLQLYQILYHYFKRFLETANDTNLSSVNYNTVAHRCSIDAATGTNLACYIDKNDLVIFIPASDLAEQFTLEPYRYIENISLQHAQPTTSKLHSYQSEQFQRIYDPKF